MCVYNCICICIYTSTRTLRASSTVRETAIFHLLYVKYPRFLTSATFLRSTPRKTRWSLFLLLLSWMCSWVCRSKSRSAVLLYSAARMALLIRSCVTCIVSHHDDIQRGEEIQEKLNIFAIPCIG